MIEELEKLHREWEHLKQVVLKELHIKELAFWLNELMKGRSRWN
jgi:hypothetical protein